MGNIIVWPCALAGDKGYCADWIDEHIMELGIKPLIRSKSNEDSDARSVDFDGEAYRDRYFVERLIEGLKNATAFSRGFRKPQRTLPVGYGRRSFNDT